MVKLYVTLLLLADDVKDRLRRDDSGATAVEYGLLVGLIAVVIVAAVTLLGTKLNGLFTSVTSGI
jgi:pilus assembly protein Flp/PilA